MQRRAFGIDHFHQRFHDHRIKCTQRRMFANEQMRIRTQRVNHAGDFHGDVTCAYHRDAFRHLIQFKEPIGINTVLRTRNRRNRRTAAGGDQNMVGGNGFTIHFHGVGINKTRKTTDHIDNVFLQHRLVRGVNAVDIRSTAGDQFLPVEMINGGIEAVIRAIQMDSLSDLRRVPHHFLRHATDVDAGAAKLFRFNQRTFFAVHGSPVNRGDTAAAAANGEVIVMFAHESYP